MNPKIWSLLNHGPKVDGVRNIYELEGDCENPGSHFTPGKGNVSHSAVKTIQT